MSENENINSKTKELQKEKKSKLKYFLNISIVLIVTIIALVITLWGNFDQVINLLSKSNWLLILAVCGLMMVCILIRGLILFLFARLYTRKYKFYQGIANDQIGVFYNAVTPGSSGGQFMQAYTFKRQGVPISSAVSIMAMYSIIFQTVLSIYGLLAFFVKFETINTINAIQFTLIPGVIDFPLPMWALTIVGFLLNVSVILLVFLMAYWKGFHNFIMGSCITFLSKIKLLKNPDKKRESLRVQVENFKMEFRRLMTNIPFTILITFFFICYFTLKFSIPYFVGLAMDKNSVNGTFWDSVFLSNYHQMVTGLIPIPGSAGVSEFFFTELFSKSQFFKVNTPGIEGASEATRAFCRAALLLWRSITFTIPLFIAGIITAFYKGAPKEVIGREGVPSRQTFVDLQSETFASRKEEFDTLINTKQLTIKAIKNRLKEDEKKKRSKTDKKTKVDKVVIKKDNNDFSKAFDKITDKKLEHFNKNNTENSFSSKKADLPIEHKKRIDNVSIEEDDDSL